jgi:hypothetical protein
LDDALRFVLDCVHSFMVTMIAYPIATACVVFALFLLGWVISKR